MGEGGVEIKADTVLDADLTCAQGPALVLVADGVVLDLGGHTVSGAPGGVTEGPGIMLRNVSGCTLRNGRVTKFDAGVAIHGGAGNLVEGVTVEDNIGTPDSDFGDGIVINDSRDNVLRGNVVRRNGPFSGISLGPRASTRST